MLHLQGPCAIMDSPLGLSFWKKVCFIQRPSTGSSARPATARAARLLPGGCGAPAVPTQPSWAPGSALSHLTSAHALLPGGLTRAAPVPTSLLIPSFLPQALGEAGGISVWCCVSQLPSVPVVGVGASPRRQSRIPGQWEQLTRGSGESPAPPG